MLRGEQEALSHFGAAVSELREMPDGTEFHVAPEVIKPLEECARLQALEIQWIEEAVKISRKIERLSPDVRQEQILHLLELRRRYLDQIDSLRTEATELETQVWKLTASEAFVPHGTENGTEPEAEQGEVYEISGDDWEIVESSPSDDARARELDAELSQAWQSLERAVGENERLLSERDRLEGELREAQSKIESLEKTDPEETPSPPAPDRIPELEREIGAIRSELDEAQRLLAATEGDTTDRLRELQSRIEQLASEKEQALARLAETEERLKENTVRLLAEKHEAEKSAEVRHAEKEAGLDAQLRALVKEHDEAKSSAESTARELARLRQELESRETELSETRKSLAKARAESISSRESAEQEMADLRENVKARGREASELRQTLAAERAEAESSSEAKDRELTALREALGERESELDQLRSAFSEERQGLEERARTAERERDQALSSRRAGLARARDLLVAFGGELTHQVENSARLLSAEAQKLTGDD